MFFIIPCIDTYEKIDMRSRKYEIPPQEVSLAPSQPRADTSKAEAGLVNNSFQYPGLDSEL